MQQSKTKKEALLLAATGATNPESAANLFNLAKSALRETDENALLETMTEMAAGDVIEGMLIARLNVLNFHCLKLIASAAKTMADEFLVDEADFLISSATAYMESFDATLDTLINYRNSKAFDSVKQN